MGGDITAVGGEFEGLLTPLRGGPASAAGREAHAARQQYPLPGDKRRCTVCEARRVLSFPAAGHYGQYKETPIGGRWNCGSPLSVAQPPADFDRNVIPDRRDVAKSGRRPAYLHLGMGSSFGLSQDSIQATTSSCGISLPAAASLMPSSIAARPCLKVNKFLDCLLDHP